MGGFASTLFGLVSCSTGTLDAVFLNTTAGIVCTLLKDEEVRELRTLPYDEATLTEGIVFEVPPSLVEECLAELDFREKGVSSFFRLQDRCTICG